MATALITAMTGQNGSYMAGRLIAKGYRVIGVDRDIQKVKESLPSGILKGVELIEWDTLE
jgi:GDP-D-mannose dehydratase